MRIHYEPDAHQDEGLAHLLANPRAILDWEMSLGKTVVTLTYLNSMIYYLGEIRRALVIAPDKVANSAWPDEIDQYEHLAGMRYCVLAGTPKQRMKLLQSDADVFIVSEGIAEWLIDLYVFQRIRKSDGEAYGEWLGTLPFDCVVIDELSKWKNQGGVRWKKLCRALDRSDVPYRVGLTGTFAPNGLQDIWGQMRLIDSGLRLGTEETSFVHTFFSTRGNGMIIYQYTPRPGAPEVLAQMISDIVDARKTRAHIPLPPMHIVDHELDMPPFERELYEALEKEYVLELYENRYAQAVEAYKALEYRNTQDGIVTCSFDEFMAAQPLVTVKTGADLTNKLLQVSSGAIYEDRVSVKDVHIWHELHTIKTQAVYDLLNQYDENFILVYQFAHEKERIMRAFPFARSLRSGKHAREDVREWNAGKIKLLIGHPASMGHGLNMQYGGRRQIWWGPTWNLEHWLQTVTRSLRRGAVDDVYIHRMIMRGTRDLTVRRRVLSKESDLDFLFNELKDLKTKYHAAIREQQRAK